VSLASLIGKIIAAPTSLKRRKLERELRQHAIDYIERAGLLPGAAKALFKLEGRNPSQEQVESFIEKWGPAFKPQRSKRAEKPEPGYL
jgi:hypothetical protein